MGQKADINQGCFLICAVMGVLFLVGCGSISAGVWAFVIFLAIAVGLKWIR